MANHFETEEPENDSSYFGKEFTDWLSGKCMAGIRLFWRFFSNPWFLTPVIIATIATFIFLERMWLVYLLTAFSACLYVVAISGREAGNVTKLAPYLLEALVSVALATGVVAVFARKGAPHFDEGHLIAGLAFAIILSGIAILAKSAHNIREAGTSLKDASGELKQAETAVQSAAAETDKATADLRDAIRALGGEISKTNLVALAARAVNVRSSTLNYLPIQKAISAAQGTLNTWAEGGMKSFKSKSATDIGRKAAEHAWWRCLESYHNEERYDLARFELVTNARNYTYLLIASLDQIRASIVLDTKGKVDQKRESDVVIVQCSTFPPKDFYNFPQGAKDHRRYRDFEFYGTYRRSISLLNRQEGMFPHRIVFISHSDSKPVIEELERNDWRLDSATTVAVGSARLFCAPYSLPLSQEEKNIPLPNFYGNPWFDPRHDCLDEVCFGGRTVYERQQVCPVVPFGDRMATGRGSVWLEKIRERISRAINEGKAYKDFDFEASEKKDVDAILEMSPQEIRTPNVKTFLLDREEWAWKTFVETAFKNIDDTPRLEEDLVYLTPQFSELQEARETMRRHLEQDTDQSARDSLCELVQSVVWNSQYFDAICAELRAQLVSPEANWAKVWMNLRSMTRLQMAPAEAWLFHALNCINGALFEELAEGRRTLPIWDLFCWDFLGMKSDKIKLAESRTWGKGRTGVGSRIRFVSVKPGNSGSEFIQDGAVSALGFDDCLQREFTLVGTRKRGNGSEGNNDPFKGVEWQLLLTCEMAPPYSTCRLNFHFREDDSGDAMLDKYQSWVEDTWRKSAKGTKDIFQVIKDELNAAESALAEAAQ